jgi:hypothetical protein
VEGTWTYSTQSCIAGLPTHSGTLIVTAPNADDHGFLRIDPESKTSFVWDDGTRYFMWGQTYYDMLQGARVNDHWKTAVDESRKYGMNKVRMHVYAQGDYSDWIRHFKSPYPDWQPYGGTPTAPTHDVLNTTRSFDGATYWQKLDEIVQFLDSRGMVAELIITNPYQNNRMFGTDTQNDRLVQYVTSRYGAYTNVIWCVANEYESANLPEKEDRQVTADFDRMGGLVRRYDPWSKADDVQSTARRPLSIHNMKSEFAFRNWSSWATHAIIQYEGVETPTSPKPMKPDEWGNLGIVRNLGHKMPVVNDEYGYIGHINTANPMGREELRRVVWGIVMAGGYGTSGDGRFFNTANPAAGDWVFDPSATHTANPEVTGDWHDAPDEYGDLKKMIDFFTTKNIEYWKMASHNELIDSGSRIYLLAEPGRQYVAYAATGGSFSIALSAGNYYICLYNPRNGEEVPRGTGTITVGTARSESFTMPNTNDDWVVRLWRADR